MNVHYGKQYQNTCVVKSWHKPPGLSRDFRGWAVMRDGREVSLHEKCSDAYAALDALS